jgi:glyceraldehyde-3-phosphate dehydrogenase (NADP+)
MTLQAPLTPREMTLTPIIAVRSPFDGAWLADVPETQVADLPALLARARIGAGVARALPRHARAAILDRAAAQIAADAEIFARRIVLEAGKTIRHARKEVARCVNTLRLSADEARRGAAR